MTPVTVMGPPPTVPALPSYPKPHPACVGAWVPQYVPVWAFPSDLSIDPLPLHQPTASPVSDAGVSPSGSFSLLSPTSKTQSFYNELQKNRSEKFMKRSVGEIVTTEGFMNKRKLIEANRKTKPKQPKKEKKVVVPKIPKPAKVSKGKGSKGKGSKGKKGKVCTIEYIYIYNCMHIYIYIYILFRMTVIVILMMMICPCQAIPISTMYSQLNWTMLHVDVIFKLIRKSGSTQKIPCVIT